MSSPKTCSSPTYRNLKTKSIQSPVELKETMRKRYKSKIQHCRDMLLNRFRGSVDGADLQNTLTDIYNTMFIHFGKECFQKEIILDEEENNILEEIKKELIQDEMDWWHEEYEKSQLNDIDWSLINQDEDVICLICQKNNFHYEHNILSCSICNIKIPTVKNLPDIKKYINESIGKHNNTCSNDCHFTVISDSADTHIYLICDKCQDMQILI